MTDHNASDHDAAETGNDDAVNHVEPNAATVVDGVADRRRVLMLGAAGMTAALTVRPAFAQTAVSVLNCEIPVPHPGAAGQYIAADGSLVPAGTTGAFPPSAAAFRGEDVRQAMNGLSLPGTSYEQSRAYMNYIRRLSPGQSGFTCYASIATRG